MVCSDGGEGGGGENSGAVILSFKMASRLQLAILWTTNK